MSPRLTSAATSTSAYGVTNTGCPAVVFRRPASQPAAYGLAACSVPGRHVAGAPTGYGCFIARTLSSSAGSIAQVSSALAA